MTGWLLGRRGGRPVALLLVATGLCVALANRLDPGWQAAHATPTVAAHTRAAATSQRPRATPLASPAAAPPAVADGPSERARAAVAFALAQRGKPYQWGAQGPGTYDCSGLAQAAYQAAGVWLPRTAAEQYHTGPPATGQLLAGDLLFFASQGPSGWHEAIYAGNGLMVEAPGQGLRVRLVPLRRRGWIGATRPAVGAGP